MRVTEEQKNCAVLVTALALLLVIFFSNVSGSSTFFLRDLGSTQLPAYGLFDSLGFARTNPHASFGQPYTPNPNLGVLFPFFKSSYAGNLQIVLALYLSFAGVFLYLRQQSLRSWPSIAGGAFFAISGYVLSSASFLNSITVIGLGSIALPAIDRFRSKRGIVRWSIATALLMLMWIAGEPALAAIITAAIVLILLLSGRKESVPALTCIAAAVAAASVYSMAIVEAMPDAYRLSVGYSMTEALGNSMHPARLLESFSPKLFGDWSSIQFPWWGFRVTSQQQPYILTTALAAPALILLILSFFRPGTVERKLAIAATAIFVLSCLGSSHIVTTALSGIGPVPLRYPVKLHLATTLLVSIAAARTLESLIDFKPQITEKRIISTVALTAGLLLICGVVPQISAPLVAELLWSDQWQTKATALPSMLARTVLPSLFVLMSIGMYAFMRAAGNKRRRQIALAGLLIATACSFRGLVPSVSRQKLEPSRFSGTAGGITGRVMERAGKDLDPVRRGFHGHYPDDDVRNLAIVQHRQMWALSGAPRGVRYAFDRDPDGSYSERMVRLTRHLDSRSWEKKASWLQHAGVAAVISYQRLPPNDFTPIEIERTIGVPAVLYAVRSPLPEVRRVSCAKQAKDFESAIAAFDEGVSRDAIVLEASDARCGADVVTVDVVSSGADKLELLTNGTKAGWLFVARAYTSLVEARVNGRRERVLPANAAFVAIPVPSGHSSVTVSFR